MVLVMGKQTRNLGKNKKEKYKNRKNHSHAHFIIVIKTAADLNELVESESVSSSIVYTFLHKSSGWPSSLFVDLTTRFSRPKPRPSLAGRHWASNGCCHQLNSLCLACSEQMKRENIKTKKKERQMNRIGGVFTTSHSRFEWAMRINKDWLKIKQKYKAGKWMAYSPGSPLSSFILDVKRSRWTNGRPRRHPTTYHHPPSRIRIVFCFFGEGKKLFSAPSLFFSSEQKKRSARLTTTYLELNESNKKTLGG